MHCTVWFCLRLKLLCHVVVVTPVLLSLFVWIALVTVRSAITFKFLASYTHYSSSVSLLICIAVNTLKREFLWDPWARAHKIWLSLFQVPIFGSSAMWLMSLCTFASYA